MYTLIGSPKTRAFRVLWMLEELGAEYEYRPDFPHSAPVSIHNPSGKVPVFLVDGEAVLDSTAIIQFLADRHGKFTFPAGTLERAHQDSFTQFALDELEGPCWNHAKHSFILPEAMRVREAKTAFRHEFERSVEIFGQRLADHPHVMGEEFTVPDLLIGHIAGWAKQCGYEWPQGNVSEYFERIRSRPAFARAWDIREAA